MLKDTVKQLRESLGLKQRELADEVYVSPSAISQYENGRTQPSRETLERMAAFFGVTTDYLLGCSPIADLEEKLRSIYHENVSVATLLQKCDDIPEDKREALLVVVNALASDSNTKGKK